MKNPTMPFVKFALLTILSFVLTTYANAGVAPLIVDRADDEAVSGTACQNQVANDCTLRAALAITNVTTGSNAIEFAQIIFGGGGTITISNELVVTSNVTIVQTNLTVPVTISAGGGSRIFNVGAGGVLNLQRLRLVKGNAGGGNGGAILNNGTLILVETTVGGDAAPDGFGNVAGQGGGIFNNGGTVTIERSTVSFNSAGGGGGIYNSNGTDGGSGGTVNLINSTVSNNSAGGGFGGGYFGFSSLGTTRLNSENSTIAENIALYGGGIAVAATVNAGVSTSTADLDNTLIGNNTAGTAGNDIYTNSATVSPLPNPSPLIITSSGYNFIEDSNGATIVAMTGDQIGAGDPRLLPLAANGGLTRTHALQTTAGTLSPAIDAGDSSLTHDQRGLSRPVDFTPNSPFAVQRAVNTDIGAFEAQITPTAASVGIGGRFVSSSGRGIAGVRVTLAEADGTSRTVLTNSFGYYRFVNVAIGQIVTIHGKAKSHQFVPRIVSVTEDTNDINFNF